VLINALFWVIFSWGRQPRVNQKLSILASVKKKKIGIDSPASSGDHAKYMKHFSFPWSPLVAAMPFFLI